ncbi:MAG: hypothetical protein HYX61_10230 [Gammaproteobacteria bacterium]|jgi:hypothetical protein|nr:hypothetical protein [Gammaproteobacteria bacterium]
MNIIQLIAFGWVTAWVLCDSLFPSMDYKSKIFTCVLSVFVAGYSNNAHGKLWEKIKLIMASKHLP